MQDSCCCRWRSRWWLPLRSPAVRTETEAAAAPREMVEDPTTGNMLLAPRYGGSISYAAIGSPPSSDVWFTHHSYNAINGVNEESRRRQLGHRP